MKIRVSKLDIIDIVAFCNFGSFSCNRDAK